MHPRGELISEKPSGRGCYVRKLAAIIDLPITQAQRDSSSNTAIIRRTVGEALAAARQAEKIRKKLGLSWEELLVPSPRQRSGDPPPEELTDWRWACHFCLERYWLLTSWELDFVATVARYTKSPSAKQLIILQRLVARCRNAAA